MGAFVSYLELTLSALGAVFVIGILLEMLETNAFWRR
jgi:hypothetical protein